MTVLLKYVLAVLLSTTAAIQLAPRSDSPRSISLPIQKSNLHPEAALRRDRNRLRKRQDGYVPVELENQINLYAINFTLGTPPQQLSLSIDTGSSDLWVNVPSSEQCSPGGGGCQGGTFDSADSTSYNVVAQDAFNISYVDGSNAAGDYATDTLGIGSVSVDNFQFGTGQISDVYQGVLGIGYQTNEVQVHDGNQPYPNLPVALKDAGHIGATAYSLWLDTLDANSGEILFGAVNTARYSGSLLTVPIVSLGGIYTSFIIALTGLTVNGQQQGSSDLPIAVLLDSGSSLSYLPAELLTPIFNEVNAVWDQNSNVGYAACNLAQTDATIQFNFSGAVIDVPYSELLIPATTVQGTGPRLENGDEACFFGISETSGHVAILGDTFLRSAYVVYDLDNNEISLANSASSRAQGDVREILASSAVPGATTVSDPVTDVPYDAGEGGRLGGPTSSGNAASGRLAISACALFVAILAASLTAS